MSYSDKLKDPRWQRKRLEILERDKFTCRDCEATNKTLHVHHCHYGKGDPWEASNDVLLTLCDNCHKQRGELETEAKLYLAKIMAKLPHEPGNQEDLQDFVKSLHEAANELDFYPLLISEGDYSWHCGMKWFRYVYDHPDPGAREMYEVVDNSKPNWAEIDAKREARQIAKWFPAG